MRLVIAIVAAYHLTACGTPIEPLVIKHLVYAAANYEKRSENPALWTQKSNTDCDALLWNALLASTEIMSAIDNAAKIDLAVARDTTTNKWYRRPVSQNPADPKPCNGTFSNDMATGLIVYAARHNEPMIMQDIYDDPRVPSPNLDSMARVLKDLIENGTTNRVWPYLQDVPAQYGTSGFESHLKALMMISYFEALEKYGATELNRGKEDQLANRNNLLALLNDYLPAAYNALPDDFAKRELPLGIPAEGQEAVDLYQYLVEVQRLSADSYIGLLMLGFRLSPSEILILLNQRDPNNPLYMVAKASFVDKDPLLALDVLMDADQKHWPNTRLPNSATEHCEFWLQQRFEFKMANSMAGVPNTDWLPCENGPDLEGGDFLFASDLLIRNYKRLHQ